MYWTHLDTDGLVCRCISVLTSKGQVVGRRERDQGSLGDLVISDEHGIHGCLLWVSLRGGGGTRLVCRAQSNNVSWAYTDHSTTLCLEARLSSA